MSTPLSILSFVRARRGPKARWVYGYVVDLTDDLTDPPSIEVRYDNGIKPVTDLFELTNVEVISDDTFDMKTKGQTALISQYWDAKGEQAEQRLTKPRTSRNAGAALKIADEFVGLIEAANRQDMPDSVTSLKLKSAARRYKAARLKHVVEG